MWSIRGLDARKDLINLLTTCLDNPDASAADVAVDPSKNAPIKRGSFMLLSRALDTLDLRPLDRLACDLASASRAAEIVDLFCDICEQVILCLI